MLPFENLRERLLRAGIPPRHASRYVTELREHLSDLAAQERATGLDARQAEERARALVGSDTQLAQAMIDKAPRSLAARAPWSVFALMPVLLLICVIGITGVVMMRLLWPLQALAPADWPTGYAILIAAANFTATYLIGPLLVAGCIMAALRQRLASGWFWVGLALIALISGPFGFHMHVLPSAYGGQEGPHFSVLGVIYQNGRLDPAATLGVAALRTAILFAAGAFAYRAVQTRFVNTRSEA
jgi:hypothetical protein